MKKIIYDQLAILIMAILPIAGLTQPNFPVEPDNPDEGFLSIFNGNDLDGWDGDPVYWKVENGTIVGEITPETIVERNTFLIWKKDKPANFELKLDYRISPEGNSGINYRSVEVPGIQWALKGYQADIDGEGRWTGQNYEERGRTFLALRGQVTQITDGQKPEVIGTPGTRDELQSFINKDGWNQVHLIIRNNIMIHMINGHIMAVVIDDDKDKRSMKGLIGVQVHVGPPMKVEYRNIRIRNLD